MKFVGDKKNPNRMVDVNTVHQKSPAPFDKLSRNNMQYVF